MSEEVFIISSIVNVEIIDGIMKYKVRWKGYGSKDDTWEPPENLIGDGAKKILSDFRETHHKKIWTLEEALKGDIDKKAAPQQLDENKVNNCLLMPYETVYSRDLSFLDFVRTSMVSQVRNNVMGIIKEVNRKYDQALTAFHNTVHMQYGCHRCAAVKVVSEGLWKSNGKLACNACKDVNAGVIAVDSMKANLIIAYNNLMFAHGNIGFVFDIRTFLAHVCWNTLKKSVALWPFSPSEEDDIRKSVSWDDLEKLCRDRHIIWNQYNKTIIDTICELSELRALLQTSFSPCNRNSSML